MGWLAVDRLCEGLEAPLPSPAGGSAAAVAGAMAASLVVMVGRGSPDWADGREAAVSATALRERLLELGAEDVEAVGAVVEARRDGEIRRQADAWLWASRVPAEIATCAADVSVLAIAGGAVGQAPDARRRRRGGVCSRGRRRRSPSPSSPPTCGSRMVPADRGTSLRDTAGQAAERAGIGPGRASHVAGARMIQTPLTELLGIAVPLLNAPMTPQAGGRLARAVSEAGAFGMIGIEETDTDDHIAEQLAIVTAEPRRTVRDRARGLGGRADDPSSSTSRSPRSRR